MGTAHFKAVLPTCTETPGQGLLEAKISLLLKLRLWDLPPRPAHLVIDDQITLGGDFPQNPFFRPQNLFRGEVLNLDVFDAC